MMDYNFNLSLILFLNSCFMFSFYYKHILLTLISLEFMNIKFYYMTFIHHKFYISNNNILLSPCFMEFMVCESIMGLSLMIYMVRMTGNDYMKSLNLMKW
uniref:NADH-ubiquinone oxidoreductase chain 4L n=1 Tax=Capitonius sp. QL-2013 TaxID=1421593 RepID=A0A0A6ZKN9_9HYME|nr:NADH dehydrogenase subunit 4L [Capitonius sp. QL-2013]